MEGLIPSDLGVPTDWRLLAGLVAIFVASFAKGVAGLGVPIIATPVIASLYDLRTAIAIVSLPMLLSDVPFVLRGLAQLRQAAGLVPFILAGLVGVSLGARILVSVSELILSAVLGAVVLAFVLSAWFNFLPLLGQRTARVAGPFVGLVAGLVQGSAGASGPIATMYLLSLGTPRTIFLFSVNVVFLLLDSTQFVALHQVGLYTPGLTALTVLACVPMGIAVFLGIKAQKHVDDTTFRRVILVILLLSAVNLLARVLSA